jgi:hypothetical protein
METITLKRTAKGTWLKKFDDYETSYTKISKAEAMESITIARSRNEMFADDNENSVGILIFGYYN